MLLHEANNYLKTSITGEELDKIHPLYCTLDLKKEQFCQLVDTLGIDVFTEKASHWEHLAKAQKERRDKDRYLRDTARADALESELQEIHRRISQYRLDYEIS